MSSTSQAMLNQGLFEEQDMSSQMGFYTSPSNWSFSTPSGSYHHQSLRFLSSNNNPSSSTGGADITCNLPENLSTTTTPKHRDFTSLLGEFETPSLQRSTNNIWPWGEVNHQYMGISKNKCLGDDHLAVAAMKMKKVKARRKVREPRFCFKTLSDVDVLDDGYKWRKYGQKVVKNTLHPRSYYRCTQDNCRVKKRVERLAEDPRMVITTYEGRHAHSPSHDMEGSESSSQMNNFFW
ncbi:probable WRKY transcription factor 13 [Telopea speciosissima]|uniref:probable WRKY transcription factor 13 n=1 Tax=Telopea speciosissima TaxID=54955 RepID=UPI001CC503EB|nr:probable WRKY transcription factor 13 [Telopea speciosissima]